MKLLLHFFSAIILIFSIFSCKKTPDPLAVRNAVIDSTVMAFQKNLYQSALDSVFKQNKFNGSIAVLRDSTVVYEKESGFENFKTKTKLSGNTVFAIGSVSKQFTAVLVMLQKQEGKLNPEDKVSKYLSEFQNLTYQNITIHQLLSHTSGISDFGGGLVSEPGKAFNYSNKGYRFLGKIIEKVSGKSYEQNAAALFQKLGMAHTATAGIFSKDHFAGANIGNETQNSTVENMPKRLSNPDISTPAGGILSTIGDLHRWNEKLYGGEILNAENLQKMTAIYTKRPHYVLGTVGYGYGIMSNLGAPKAFFHTGYVKGSPSLNIYYPETKTSVIILSNIADESKGKEGFFQPHAEVKKLSDAVENSVNEVRKSLLKTIPENH